jgi:hypothetical protein
MGISLLFTLNNLVAFTLWTLAGAGLEQGASCHTAASGLWIVLGWGGFVAYFDAPALAPVCQHAQALRHVRPHRQPQTRLISSLKGRDDQPMPLWRFAALQFTVKRPHC